MAENGSVGSVHFQSFGSASSFASLQRQLPLRMFEESEIGDCAIRMP